MTMKLVLRIFYVWNFFPNEMPAWPYSGRLLVKTAAGVVSFAGLLFAVVSAATLTPHPPPPPPPTSPTPPLPPPLLRLPSDTQRSSSETPSNGCPSPDRKRLTPDGLARPLSPDGPEILSELCRYTAGAEPAGGQERPPEGAGGGGKGEGAGRPGGEPVTALDLRGTKRKSSTPSSEEPGAKQPPAKRTSAALPLQGLPLGAGYGLPSVGLSPALLGSMGHPMFMGAGSPYFQPHGQLGDPRLMFPVTPDPFGLPGASSSGPSSSSGASAPSSSGGSGAGSASLSPFLLGSGMAGMLPPGFPLSYGQSLLPEPRMYPASLLPGGLPATPGPAGASFLSHFPSLGHLGTPLRRNAHVVAENGGSSSDDDVIEVTGQ